MKFKRQRHEEIGVNLTSLIDVVFLLLIFFMVSTTFTKESHLKLTLPTASGEVTEQASRLIDITISAKGVYTVNGQSLVNNRLDTLKRAIGKEARSQKDLPLIITADAQTPHQSVITAMDAAGQMGFSNLRITTRHSKGES